jgi:hypothetical protein
VNTSSDGVATISTTKRCLNGIITAVVVGAVSTGVALAPALFIQAVFIGEAQRCATQVAFEKAANGEVTSTCVEDLTDPPLWFPTLIAGAGGGLGLIGGFVYGVARPPQKKRRR